MILNIFFNFKNLVGNDVNFSFNPNDFFINKIRLISPLELKDTFSFNMIDTISFNKLFEIMINVLRIKILCLFLIFLW